MFYWVEAKDAANHPIMCKTVPPSTPTTKKSSGSNVNSATDFDFPLKWEKPLEGSEKYDIIQT